MNPLEMQVTLGQVVRAKRSQLGYSQEAFADGELIIKWERKIKNKGNAVSAS